MKTKLLLIFLVTTLGYSQTAIENFDSVSGSEYVLVSSVDIDQDNLPALGSLYEINNLVQTSTTFTVDSHSSPSSGVSVYTANGEGGTSIITTSQIGGNVAYTKVETNTGIVLTYSDVADVGMFPWNFDTSNPGNNINSDTSAGTFVVPGVPIVVNFTGTITSEVDWYGTLKINNVLAGVGTSDFDGEVTRLKVEQNLVLNAGIAGSGTAKLTTYLYYDANSDNIVFRSTSISALFNPLVGDTISLEDSIIESLVSTPLSTSKDFISKSEVSIFPNPVQNNLNFIYGNDVIVDLITVSDLSGRQILRTNKKVTSLSAEQLSVGMYIVSISTNKGLWSEKFIKK